MIPLWDVQISPLQTQSRIRLPGDKGSWTCWTWTRASDRARWWWWSVSQFSRSVESDSVTPWITAHQASLSITNSRSLLKFISMLSVMPSNHLILCHPLLLLQSIFPSIRVFSNESTLHIRWPKYWSTKPSKEYSELISFRIDWLDLLVVQGTFKSLLQHHSSKTSILQHSAFFISLFKLFFEFWFWFCLLESWIVNHPIRHL